MARGAARSKRLLLVLLAAAAALVSLASAAPAGQPHFYVSAVLTRDEVLPRPRGASDASGRLSGYLKGRELSWRLTLSRLSGRATAAHIHIARRRSVNRKAAVNLCAPCPASETRDNVVGPGRSLMLGPGTMRALRAGVAYIDVHTKRNRRGEVRGQIVLVAASPPRR